LVLVQKTFFGELKMADLKLWGKAYSTSGNVSVTISVNDTEVFNGEVTTTNASTPAHAVAESIAAVTINDDLMGAPVGVVVNVTGGDLILMGFGTADSAFGDQPGQLKSNVVIDGGTAYSPTDADILATGVYVDDGANPGEFHIDITDGSIVSFDYALPAA